MLTGPSEGRLIDSVNNSNSSTVGYEVNHVAVVYCDGGSTIQYNLTFSD